MQQLPKDLGDGNDGNSMNDFLNKYLPYWPFFLLLVLISLAGAWLYLRYKVPVYQASATLLIKDDKKGIGSGNALEAFDIFGSKKIVENEIQVLQSKTLAHEVVKNLLLYAPIHAEGRILNKPAFVISPVSIEVRNADSIKQTGKVYFKYLADQKVVVINEKKYPLDQWSNTPFGTLRFIPNKRYDSRSGDDTKLYFTLMSLKSSTNNILSRIKVLPSSKQSTVIELTITDEIPERGEAILNELIEAYNRAAILDKNLLATNTLAFVEERLKYVVNELDSVESRLESFKVRNKITDISSQGQIFLQTVSENDQKLSELSMQRAVLDQVEGYVRGKIGSGSLVPSTLGISDLVLSQLLEKLYNLELQYEQQKKLVPANNPTLVSLVDAINMIRPSILENINSQRKNLESGQNSLNVTNKKYASILSSIPEKEKELLGISRQQAIKNNIYTFLLQKREESALSFASTVADSRIVDKAEASAHPIGPKKTFIYLIAVISAISAGIMMVFIKDMLTRTIQQKSDIEKLTRVPFLGEVMYDNSKATVVIEEGKRSFVAEQFRQLRTSLSYLGINQSHKKILVTSTISGEGKSFIATNLGISLSLMGKKVVLIELDLRKPKLSDGFNVSRAVGISNYLIAQKDAEEVLLKTEFPNLAIITSGPLPPNPSELIANGRILELFEYLENNFDYIIIDTAPINPVTDAFILSPLCDATLFIVRHDYTPKLFIQKIEEQNRIKSLKIMIQNFYFIFLLA